MSSETIAVTILTALTVILAAGIAAMVFSIPEPEPLRALETTSTCLSGTLSCYP